MISQARVELALELHPMQTEGVEESRQAFHEDENADGEHGPEAEDGPQGDAPVPVPERQTVSHHHVPQHFGQLWKTAVHREQRLQLSK